MSKNSSSRTKTFFQTRNKCSNCGKNDKSVTTRPTRIGTCNYCKNCYETQILMS